MAKSKKDIKPKATESNPYDKLSLKEKTIVDMAVYGYTYPKIAKATKKSHQTIKDYFYKGGRLHTAYQWRLKEYRAEYEQRFKEIDKMIQDGAVDAIGKLLEAVKQSGTWPTTILAAKDLLDRAGFTPTQKFTGDITQKTDEKAVQALDKLAEYVRQNNNKRSKGTA